MSKGNTKDGKLAPIPEWRGRSSSDRIKLIQTAFVFHSQCAFALDALQKQLFISGGQGPGRLILLAGEHGCGKTAIIRKLVDEHPPITTDKVDQRPIIVTTPTENVAADGLATAIIRDAAWPLKGKFFDKKIPEKAVFHVLGESGTKLLVVNKANLLLKDRKTIASQTEPFLLSLLVNGISLVLVGDENFPDMLSRTPSINSYLAVHCPLRPIIDPDEWRVICADFERQLPFEQTELLLGEMPEQTLYATGGKLPGLARLTENAATEFFWPTPGPRSGECLSAAHFFSGFKQKFPHRFNPFDADWKKLLLEGKRAAAKLQAKKSLADQWREANRGD